MCGHSRVRITPSNFGQAESGAPDGLIVRPTSLAQGLFSLIRYTSDRVLGSRISPISCRIFCLRQVPEDHRCWVRFSLAGGASAPHHGLGQGEGHGEGPADQLQQCARARIVGLLGETVPRMIRCMHTSAVFLFVEIQVLLAWGFGASSLEPSI